MRLTSLRKIVAPGVAACAATLSLAVAQERSIPPRFVEIGLPEIHGPDSDVDIPQPPRAIGATRAVPAPHGMPAVPPGQPNGLPEPDSPPTGGALPPGAPCSMRYFVNRIVEPGGNAGEVAEPSAAFRRDTSFFTWNWGAALSRDAGMSWEYVNPYSKFPAVDGGFCCDQRTMHVASHDMTVWYLQYSKSATTQLGHVRIAIAPSRASLAANSWHSYTFAPDNFGFGTGEWLDFPDIAVTNNHLYCASNIFSVANNSYVSSVVWKMPLSTLDSGGLLGANFWTRAALGGGSSYRLTQGATSTMFMASHNSTNSLRVIRNADLPFGSSMVGSNISVSSWGGGSMVATAPNGTNWAGRADTRISGAYANGAEYGFMWHIGRRTSSGRPQAYVRVARIATLNHALFNEQDIWDSSWAFLYPAATTNAAGEPGYTCAFGTGDGNAAGRHPSNFFRVVDPNGCGVNFSGGGISIPFAGGSSPTQPLWGDYFTVQRADSGNTFVASGTTLNASGDMKPRYVWFGKEEDTPPSVFLDVQSTLALSVPITVAHMDLDTQKSGSTPFRRRYVQAGRYELTAPAVVTNGAFDYSFVRWRYKISPTGTWFDQPEGQLTLSVDSLGATSDVAETVYVQQTTFSVDASNASNVSITASKQDLDGNQNGVTGFTRRYASLDFPFAFTAPATTGNQPFRRWYIDGVPQSIGQRTVSITPITTSSVALVAEYCTHVQGGYQTYGAGCTSSTGQVPSHTSSSTPDIGALVTHNVSGLRGLSPAVMFLGFSKTMWNGVPLPLSLGLIGSNPACNVLAEGFLDLPITIDGSGSGSRTFRVLSDPAAIGTHVYTQVIAADLFLPDPIPLVASNGLDMLIGGSSIGGQRCP